MVGQGGVNSRGGGLKVLDQRGKIFFGNIEAITGGQDEIGQDEAEQRFAEWLSNDLPIDGEVVKKTENSIHAQVIVSLGRKGGSVYV